MRIIPSGAAMLALALLACCAPPPAPPPAAAPPPAPPQRPAPPPPPPLAWQAAPLSAGDWSWRDEGGRSEASFGSSAPEFILRCEPGRRVRLRRVGAAGGALTVRTTNADRALAAAEQTDGLVADLNAADPLLDAIVFSRGRFAVEAGGAALLILPAWPEPARVIEDCRS